MTDTKMNVLDSILSTMEKPPSMDGKQRQQQEGTDCAKKAKEELQRYRKYVQERLSRFSMDGRRSIEFRPTDKIHRVVVYDICETYDFITMAFVHSDEEKYIVAYKKDFPPCNDEVTARQNGEGWNELVAREYANKRRLQQVREAFINERILAQSDAKSTPIEEVPVQTTTTTLKYQEKYVHLIGDNTCPLAVSKEATNRTYGIVPSQNKTDQRSIEQTLNDIRAKKRQRMADDASKTKESDVSCTVRILRSPSNSVHNVQTRKKANNVPK